MVDKKIPKPPILEEVKTDIRGNLWDVLFKTHQLKICVKPILEAQRDADAEYYESRLQEELDQIRIDVAELNKKLNDREADLLNVKAETLKEVGEWLEKKKWIRELASYWLYRIRKVDIKALKRGEMPKE